MKPLFSKQLTKKISVSLEGENVQAGSPLFAINWFDTRVAALYHFYNTMAASRVFRIGGKVFMKAKVGKQLVGDSEMKRQFLLIVNYPSPEAFLTLVGDPVFQVISLLRTTAVKHVFPFASTSALRSRSSWKPAFKTTTSPRSMPS